MKLRTPTLTLTALLLGSLAACGGDSDPADPANAPPVARFTVDPPTIPQEDDHNTPVTLDARASSDPDGDEITFQWTVPGGFFVEETGPASPLAHVTLPGDQPVTVTLTVTDGRGGEDSEEAQVGLESDPGDGGDPEVAFRVLLTGLAQPVHLSTPAGDPRLFIVEKGGLIRIVRDGSLEPEPFLDLSDRVSGGGERGLLSVAFHPDYAGNGRFFVNYTDLDGATVVEEYAVSADPDRADPASGRQLIRISQPFANHNGGQLQFGPDGMLYIGMGDGGSAGDPGDRAQDLSTLLGKLLRIDVDAEGPYAVPSDNPFLGDPDARDEIWALGLRNPWRFSFDPAEGTLYVADVGQSTWEEVNAVAPDDAGVNYGWRRLEGRACFESGCSSQGTTLPVLVYSHAEGCSITGGRVYRGAELPALRGHYFYADLCSGWVRSFLLSGGEATETTEWASALGSITSFGVDAGGELHVLTIEGTVYRLEAE